MTYNQSGYIKDALDGFVMQETTFPFVATIVDDASTDGEPGVIQEYLTVNFDFDDTNISYIKETEYAKILFARHKLNRKCYFAVLLLKENLYQKREQKDKYLAAWRDNVKYRAICEGDDYWIAPDKLQKQVDWLESHEGYSMCCSDAVIKSPQGELDWNRYEKDADIYPPEMIMGSGAYIQTNTILYRQSILDRYPDVCRNCHVGDFPLQIWASLNGKVRYFAEKQTVYRFQANASWTSRQQKLSLEKLILGWKTEINMLRGLNKLTGKKYDFAFSLFAFWFISLQEEMHSDFNSTIRNRFSQVYNIDFLKMIDVLLKWNNSCENDVVQQKWRVDFCYSVLHYYYLLGITSPLKHLFNIKNLDKNLALQFSPIYDRLSSAAFKVNDNYYTKDKVLSGYAAFKELWLVKTIDKIRVHLAIGRLFRK